MRRFGLILFLFIATAVDYGRAYAHSPDMTTTEIVSELQNLATQLKYARNRLENRFSTQGRLGEEIYLSAQAAFIERS